MSLDGAFQSYTGVVCLVFSAGIPTYGNGKQCDLFVLQAWLYLTKLPHLAGTGRLLRPCCFGGTCVIRKAGHCTRTTWLENVLEKNFKNHSSECEKPPAT